MPEVREKGEAIPDGRGPGTGVAPPAGRAESATERRGYPEQVDVRALDELDAGFHGAGLYTPHMGVETTVPQSGQPCGFGRTLPGGGRPCRRPCRRAQPCGGRSRAARATRRVVRRRRCPAALPPECGRRGPGCGGERRRRGEGRRDGGAERDGGPERGGGKHRTRSSAASAVVSDGGRYRNRRSDRVVRSPSWPLRRRCRSAAGRAAAAPPRASR